MENSPFVESLDSLWFFNNILSPKTQLPGCTSGHKLTENINQEYRTNKKEERAALPTPVEKQQNASLSLRVENYALRCPRCGEIPAENQPQIIEPVETQELDVPTSQQIKELRNRRRRTRRRRVLDFGLGIEKFSPDLWTFKDASGYQNDSIPYKMPPLSDDTVMKQRLKYWAYAVACTVR